jgi:hypothetical protein
MMFNEIDAGLCEDPISAKAEEHLTKFCEGWSFDKEEVRATWIMMAKARRDNLTWSKIENRYISDEYRNSSEYQAKLNEA